LTPIFQTQYSQRITNMVK